MSTASAANPTNLPPPKSPAPKKRSRPKKPKPDASGATPSTPATPGSASSSPNPSISLTSNTPSLPAKPALKKSRPSESKQKKSLQFSIDTSASNMSGGGDDSILDGDDSNDVPPDKSVTSIGEEDLSDDDDLDDSNKTKSKQQQGETEASEVTYEALTEAEQAQIEEEEKEEEEKEQRTKSVLKDFSEEQMQRYEYYRRSSLQKGSIKKIMQGIAGVPISQQTAIVMSGISKVYVGEIIELARTIMDQEKKGNEECGPLRPRHLLEAHRRLQAAGTAPPLTKFPSRLFKR